MIHYFITWFEYNGHHEKCMSASEMGVPTVAAKFYEHKVESAM
jgi:hypothetical protein